MMDWLASRALISPDACALVIGDETWSYGRLDFLADNIAAQLAHLVAPGEQVAVLMPNNLVYVGLVHALARSGITLVPLNTRLTVNELAWQLEHTTPRVLVYSAETAKLANALQEYVDHLVDDQSLIENEPQKRTRSHPRFSQNNIQAIIFTSGTSGNPKGAMLTFRNHFYSAAASALRLGIDAHDRWLSCLPLYHVGGLAVIFRSCLYGTTVVLHEGFHVEAVSSSLDDQAITLISLVPTMVHRLLDFRNGRPWPTTLRHLLLGGAAAAESLWQEMINLKIPVTPTYGLTEAASQVATMRPEVSRIKPGSAGKALKFTTMQIMNEQGQPLPAGEIGEIVVSGPTVMAGYYRDPQKTAAVLKDGRLWTGDMGYLDDEGDLWLVQRRSDLIISGGENIYPVEIEQLLRKHPLVQEVCVVGISNDEWGQCVAAMIAVPDGEQPTEDDLVAFCREYLAGYKIPKTWRFANHLPKTASGKVHRKKVQQALENQPLAE